MDALLLKILKHREHYENLIPELDTDTLHGTTAFVLDKFGNWFASTKDTVIDMEDFKAYFFNFIQHMATDEKKRYFNNLFDKCRVDATPEQTEFIIEKIISHTFATHMGNLVVQYNDDAEIDIIEEVGIKHTKAVEKLQRETIDLSLDMDGIEGVLDKDENKIGVKFDLGVLRDNLRPMQSGDFIIAAGRPDSGKTSFLASQFVSFLDSVEGGRPIIWFNNEGEGNRIIKRIYQSVLQATTKDLLKYRQEGDLNKRFKLRVQNPERIKIIDCHGWSTHDVEKTVKKFNPGLVIVDMIDNIIFPDSRFQSRTDQILEGQYQWFRLLGVKYHFPVIATSQVSAEAEQQTHTQMWPAMHMLKDSKTGKQGAADCIIMIGRNLSPDSPENIRYISTPKNKLAIERSNIKMAVTFDAQRARYE